MEMTRAEAEALLAWAAGQNPGGWINHSQTVARAAEAIAAACGLDRDRAYIYGLLHDIGYWAKGPYHLHHIIEGSRLMEQKGHPDVAKICLSHSFLGKIFDTYIANSEVCPPGDVAFIASWLESCAFDDYDNLIQLCDSISLTTGVCLLEVRLFDIARRFRINEFTQPRWDAIFAIKRDFDARCGGSIYSLFRAEICAALFP